MSRPSGADCERLAAAHFVVPPMPWQRKFWRAACRPGIDTVALTMARGGGKTATVAVVAAAWALRLPGADICVVAASFEQAKVMVRDIRAILRPFATREAGWVWRDNSQRCEAEHPESGTRIRTLGSQPGRLHGLRAQLLLLDEPAQWPGPSGEEMFAALATARGKLPHSRMIICGTRAADPSHWFERVLVDHSQRERSHVISYQAAPDTDPHDRRAWHRSNPSLRYGLPSREIMESEADAAAVDTGALASFRALRLNAGCPATEAVTGLLSAGVWAGLPPAPKPEGPHVLGVDLGGSVSLAAVAAYWPATGRLDALAATGTIPSLSSRGKKLGASEAFLRAQADGQLVVTEGRNADPAALITTALDRWGTPAALICDRYRASELRDLIDREPRLARLNVVWRGQGWREGSEDVRRFVRWCHDGKVKPVSSELLDRSVACARLTHDPAGNSKLSHRAEKPDDLAAAAVLAVAHASRHPVKKREFKIYVTGQRR